jgi:hypothetical protein
MYKSWIAPAELDRLEREITATDQQIDTLVYELYGITIDERKIIEGDQAWQKLHFESTVIRY